MTDDSKDNMLKKWSKAETVSPALATVTMGSPWPVSVTVKRHRGWKCYIIEAYQLATAVDTYTFQPSPKHPLCLQFREDTAFFFFTSLQTISKPPMS